eukprot:CFRG4712T1
MNYVNNPTGGVSDVSNNDFVGRIVTVAGVKYKVIRQIAEGGFAYVFLVKDQNRNIFALKRLIVPDKDAMVSAQQEINVMKIGDRHEGFVRLIGSETLSNRISGHSNAEVLIVMELCPGSLIHIMNDRRDGFEPHDVVRCFQAITSAVRFLHEQHPPIIHRDLKVENILVDVNSNVKLCDFGSATTTVMNPKTAAQIAMAEEEIQLNTTPQYRAPEMWDFYAHGTVDYKSDIWALGCILYKLCYYRTPYDDGSKAYLKLPTTNSPNAVFHDILRECLKKDPSQRPNAGQVVQMLDEVTKKLPPKRGGDRDALAVPVDDMKRLVGGDDMTSNLQDRMMGAFRTVKSKVEDAVASTGLAINPVRNKGLEVDGDMDYSYITPRIMAMRVPNFRAVQSMNSFLDGSYRNKYFVWNISQLDYPTAAFNDCVRHVGSLKARALPLDDLYDVCESINSWLLSDRDNVAVIHCQTGISKTIPVVVSYLLFTQLFTSPEVAVAHCQMKQRMKTNMKIRPSAKRQAANILSIVQGRPPKIQSMRINYVVFPNLPVFTSHPAKPYVCVQDRSKVQFSSKDTIPDLSGDSVRVDCGQSFSGDFTLQLMVPTRDGPGAHLCLVQLHTGYLEPGYHQFEVSDLDSPVKSLGSDFFLAVDVVTGENKPSNKSTPWKGVSSRPDQAISACFFNDSEARGQLKAYERDLVGLLGNSAADFIHSRQSSVTARDTGVGGEDGEGYRTTRTSTRTSTRSNRHRKLSDNASNTAINHSTSIVSSQQPTTSNRQLIDLLGGDLGNTDTTPINTTQTDVTVGMGVSVSVSVSDSGNSFGGMSVSDGEGDGDDFFMSGDMDDAFGMNTGGATTTGVSDGLDLLDLGSDGGGGNKSTAPQSAFDLLGLDDTHVTNPSTTTASDPFATDMLAMNDTVMTPNNASLGETGEMHRSHSAVFEQANKGNIPRSHSVADFDNSPTLTPTAVSETRSASRSRGLSSSSRSPVPTDPFGSLTSGAMPQHTSTRKTSTSNLATSPSAHQHSHTSTSLNNLYGNAGGGRGLGVGMSGGTSGMSNYTPSPMQPSPSESPVRSPRSTSRNHNRGQPISAPSSTNVDPFGGLSQFGVSSCGSGVSTRGSPLMSMKSTPHQQYKQTQSPITQSRTNTQQTTAQHQRQTQQKEQQAKAAKHKTEQQWAKQQKPVHSQQPGGNFVDLLGMHNFTPVSKEKTNQSINDLREVTLLEDDKDGTAAIRINVSKWTAGKIGNVRALISTLPEVLWEESGWAPIGIDKMLKPVGVKKSFMKACLIVHPDKVQDTEHQYLASLVFDELNKAYSAFKDAGSPGLV